MCGLFNKLPATLRAPHIWQVAYIDTDIDYNTYLYTHFEYRHSHKKRKDSLETRAVLAEISMLC